MVLLTLLSVLCFALITRADVETTVLKVPGTLYQREPGFITNLYNIELVNKTFHEITVDIKVESPITAQLYKADGKIMVLPGEGIVKSIYFIKIPEKDIMNARTVVTLGVYQDNKRIETCKVKFIGPVHKAADAKRN